MTVNRVFTDPRPQQFKSDGVSTNSNGKLYFREPGSGSTTLKTVYADKELTTALTNPVQLTNSGRYPEIHLNGDYNVQLTDSADVQIWRVDNYQPDIGVSGQFLDWDVTVSYAVNDYVRYTDGNYYVSQQSGNVGNIPSSAFAYWSQAYFLEVYNSSKEYMTGNTVEYNGNLYISYATSTGVTPGTDNSVWRFPGQASPKTNMIDTGFSYYRDDSTATYTFGIDTNLTEGAYESIGPSGSGADHTWSDLDTVSSNAKVLILAVDVGGTKTTGTDASFSISTNFRKDGGSALFMGPRAVGFGGGTVNDHAGATATIEVPLSDDGVFEAQWNSSGSPDSDSVTISYQGYRE